MKLVFFLLVTPSKDTERKRAFVHLKELLTSVKVKLDPRFVSLPGNEIAVKFRGQRDCHIRVWERFIHKALVEKNLGKKKKTTKMSHKHGSIPVGVEQFQLFSWVI